jgi:hypothetical protein
MAVRLGGEGGVDGDQVELIESFINPQGGLRDHPPEGTDW